MVPDVYAAIRPVIDIFQKLGIPYHIGGSVASSAFGVARTTLDVDLVAGILPRHVDTIVAGLSDEYYVDVEMIRDAISRRSSFNLVHLSTMIKVDVFLPKEDEYERESFSRRRREQLMNDVEDRVYVASAEDVVLHKLDWYRQGGETSDRQWSDITGVLRVQADAIDVTYLRRWADHLGLGTLLERALSEAGVAN